MHFKNNSIIEVSCKDYRGDSHHNPQKVKLSLEGSLFPAKE